MGHWTKRTCIVILSSLVATVSYAGGGWVNAPGEGYFKLGQSAISAHRFYNGKAESVDIITTRLFVTSIYGEFGITDRLTSIGYVPFVNTTVNALVSELTRNVIINNDHFNGFGDIDLALKYGLVNNGPVVVSASLWAGIPLGLTNGGNSGLLQTGDGEFNQLLRLDASTSWNSFYFSGYSGLNNRTKNFSEEVRLGAEVGFYKSGLLVDLKFDMIHSLKNGTAVSAENGLFANDMEHKSLTAEVGYIYDETWGITGSVAMPLAGRNILNGTYYNVGIVFKLQSKEECDVCPSADPK